MFKNDLNATNKLETLNQQDDGEKLENNSNFVQVEHASPQAKDVELEAGSDIELSSDENDQIIADNQ